MLNKWVYQQLNVIKIPKKINILLDNCGWKIIAEVTNILMFFLLRLHEKLGPRHVHFSPRPFHFDRPFLRGQGHDPVIRRLPQARAHPKSPGRRSEGQVRKAMIQLWRWLLWLSFGTKFWYLCNVLIRCWINRNWKSKNRLQFQFKLMSKLRKEPATCY